MSAQPARMDSQERSAATRARIVHVAREIVTECGYDGLSTAAVLRRAKVSRGGLYHHFDGKTELVAAVLDAVERDFVARLAVVAAQAQTPYEAIAAGTRWYLDECASSLELQRAALLEGRRALGWERWREVVDPYGLSMLEATLAEAMASGEIVPADPYSLAHLLLAALHETAALIAGSGDPAAARERAGGAAIALLDGLRSPADG